MFVLHVALQGCLRGASVEYGITADTGGHIRYLLDLVAASRRHPAIDRIEIVTRAFRHGAMSASYDQAIEALDATTRIVRLRSASADYLAKEQLWTQHDSLVDALVDHIERLDRRPDVIHAHYADAGAVVARVAARLGIPYVFTAHSLGHVKRAAFAADCPETAGLDRRIAFEDAAIAGAAAIVASSRDEAEVQYAAYDGYDPGRVRIIAPGSDLAAFRDAAPAAHVDAAIDRFLTDPSKPVILAIARPVTKKNLAALIHAYGRSPTLQAQANLVVVAGTRDDLTTLEPEICGNLTEMLALIDRYDLYGRVAYPKAHRPEDIPAYYAYARARRGVFANPALNEPFGLTLLEAAASGLPVVATDSGGPNDIVETCGNGLLVDPRSPDGIAEALSAILDDPERWERYSANGARAVAVFDWDKHVAIYADLLTGIVGAACDPIETPTPDHLLVSDIDGTLLGCTDGVAAFGAWHGSEPGTMFAVATGRSFHSALSVLAQQDAPVPEIVIASVGSEIYWRTPSGVYARDARWDAIVANGWDREAIAALLAEDSTLVPQAPLEQRRFKLSYFADDARVAARVRTRLAKAGYSCSIIHSHDRYLDILPHAASKGTAVEHVRRTLGLPPTRVIVAGDSGNDVEMLRSSPLAIIVGNHSDGLAARPDLAHAHVARGHHARGVIEGVLHLRGRADIDEAARTG